MIWSAKHLQKWYKEMVWPFMPPKPIPKKTIDDDSGKVIKILKKDSFDEEFGSLVESGFISPLEYYRWKEIYKYLEIKEPAKDFCKFHF